MRIAIHLNIHFNKNIQPLNKIKFKITFTFYNLKTQLQIAINEIVQ